MEIWKVIQGYENYMISNCGNVKSLGNNKARKEKILKPINNKGHQTVLLYKNGKGKWFRVHRLVEQAFSANCFSIINNVATTHSKKSEIYKFFNFL